MKIDLEIKEWDGKSVDYLRLLYKLHSQESAFVSNIVKLLKRVPLQIGATWLLKHHLTNNKIEQKDVNKIYQKLSILKDWETKLHVLQCLSFMPITNGYKKKVEQFLRDNLKESNKFVRAWTYNGFHILAIQYPEYQKETNQLFEKAMSNEAASVKARIRNLLKHPIKNPANKELS